MDVTEVILRDHVWFRERFIALYDLRVAIPPDTEAIARIWDPLAARLDVHAAGEEEIFYPQLLARGEDPEDETLDAIGDHNDIRDGVHAALRHPVASEGWWAAVETAREANDEHMAEEEREGIADFRQHAPAGASRERLGRQLEDFLERHPTTAGVDVEDKDPEAYVDEIESELHATDNGGATARGVDGSLGIGSLRRTTP